MAKMTVQRTLYVPDESALQIQMNNFIVGGYKLVKQNGNRNARLIKPHKASIGFCLLWFIMGLLPLAFYLLYCHEAKPDDDVTIQVRSYGGQANTKTGRKVTCPKCGRQHSVTEGSYCPYCGYKEGDSLSTDETKSEDESSVRPENSIDDIKS